MTWCPRSQHCCCMQDELGSGLTVDLTPELAAVQDADR